MNNSTSNTGGGSGALIVVALLILAAIANAWKASQEIDTPKQEQHETTAP